MVICHGFDFQSPLEERKEMGTEYHKPAIALLLLLYSKAATEEAYLHLVSSIFGRAH
jgi:hypothetical protein